MEDPTIDALLAARRARRIGAPGSPALARAHLALNRMLWREYDAFSRLRPTLSYQSIRITAGNVRSRTIVRRLVSAGVLIRNGTHRFRSIAAKRYLTGGWLEELAYCAMLEAGAEEAYYAQKIAWTVGDTEGENEIDVIARRGATLSLVSCKTASPIYRSNRRLFKRLENQLFEAHYWDQHFAEGDARALLMITTDLYDEARARPRSATLLARATILDVDVIGRDLTWERLVAAIRDHW